MRGLVRLVGLAVLEPGAVGQVLVQRAAAGDVERLHPAADREQRQVARGGLAQQRQLVLVADAVDVRAELRVALVAVGRGVEVRAAAEEQAVDAVQQRRDVVHEPVRRQHDRDPARLLHRLRVAEAQRQPRRVAVTRGAVRREPPRGGRLGAQLVRDDADQRRELGAVTGDTEMMQREGRLIHRASRPLGVPVCTHHGWGWPHGHCTGSHGRKAGPHGADCRAMTRIAVLDRHPAVRAGLRALFEAQHGLALGGLRQRHARPAPAALSRRSRRPDRRPARGDPAREARGAAHARPPLRRPTRRPSSCSRPRSPAPTACSTRPPTRASCCAPCAASACCRRSGCASRPARRRGWTRATGRSSPCAWPARRRARSRASSGSTSPRSTRASRRSSPSSRASRATAFA